MRKSFIRTVAITLLFLMTLSACGGSAGGGTTSAGDPRRGEDLYKKTTIGEIPSLGCTTCHLYNAVLGEDTSAPYTAGVGSRAASRVPGMSAEEYLRQSIVDPDAYIVDGYAGGVMFQTWGDTLTEQEIEDLVSYLLTEK